MQKNGTPPIKGACFFYTETGTEGGHWAFQNEKHISPHEWSYEGLYVLENGDRLTIFSPDDPEKIIWSGTISLNPYPAFTEHVFGFWIHADQKSTKREIWAKYFFEEYPAELIPIRTR